MPGNLQTENIVSDPPPTIVVSLTTTPQLSLSLSLSLSEKANYPRKNVIMDKVQTEINFHGRSLAA
jgi:hypothetical protein